MYRDPDATDQLIHIVLLVPDTIGNFKQTCDFTPRFSATILRTSGAGDDIAKAQLK
jgi:hypothetical protein